jgi:endonuclease/exonuclease/phosphatase family metal-dependent hydrolase
MQNFLPIKSGTLIKIISCIISLLLLNSCPDRTIGPQGPATPYNIKLELINPDSIQLSWDYAMDNDEVTFLIERRVGSDSWVKNYAAVPEETHLFAEPLQFKSDTLVAYQLRAATETDTSTESAAVAWFPAGTIPINIRVKQIDRQNLRLSWTDCSVGEDYFIVDKKIGNGEWQNQYQLLDGNTTEYLDQANNTSDSIFYRVAAKIGISQSDYSSIVGSKIASLSLADLYFGTDQSFEIMTWNAHDFPRNNNSTISGMARAIRSLEVDIVAFQEIANSGSFAQLADSLPEYHAFRANSAYQDLNLAYLYNTATITVDSIYEILTNERNALPRAPLVLEGNWKNIPIVVINNHYKAYGDGLLVKGDSDDEEYRRFMASELLRDYILTNFNERNVVTVGDFNDELTDSQNNNVFQPFLDLSLKFQFADLSIATGSSAYWSYPTWPSHIDHILISDQLFDEFNDTRSLAQTILVDNYLPGNWNSYAVTFSDHRPVALKLFFQN